MPQKWIYSWPVSNMMWNYPLYIPWLDKKRSDDVPGPKHLISDNKVNRNIEMENPNVQNTEHWNLQAMPEEHDSIRYKIKT